MAAWNRSLTMFRIGAWSWIVIAAGHLTLATIMTLRAPSSDAGGVATVQEYPIDFGVDRTLEEVNQGVSLVMTMALVFGGAACLIVARSAPELVTRRRALTALALAGSLIGFGVSAWLLPPPPTILFAIASVAFGSALVPARRATAS